MLTFALSFFGYAFGPSREDGSAVPRGRRTSAQAPARPPELSGTDRYLHLPDAEIVRGIRAGDLTMFERVFRAYATPLARWAYTLTSDPTVAEDAAADVLASVWEQHDTWTVQKSVEAYLFGAVKNRIRALIAAETADTILSDDKLVEVLKADGFDIARRTVAKYRESLGLGSSVQRRRAALLGGVRAA